MTEKKRVRNYARKEGYDDAEFVAEYEDYRCYNPVFTDGKRHNIGLPDFILVDKKDGGIRMTEGNETMKIYDKLYPPEKFGTIQKK